ncbi:MAG: hypothetical protein ACK5KP_08675 [Paludibacteraceae bacterium]
MDSITTFSNKILLKSNDSIIRISFQETGGVVFDPIRERIRKHKSKIRARGADDLVFSRTDVVIDNYTYIVSLLGERFENLENRMALRILCHVGSNDCDGRIHDLVL